jgi:hypothetical protein
VASGVVSLRYRNDVPRDPRYSAGIGPDVLAPGECAIGKDENGTWLAFSFTRTTDGKPETRRIPIHVGGPPTHNVEGKGGAWGFTRVSPGVWQVSPSIQCLEQRRDPNDPTKHVDVETWHETPQVVDVPENEPWMAGAAP